MARTIVVAVDFSEESRRAMEAAAGLAEDLDATVVLAHAFAPVAVPDEEGRITAPLQPDLDLAEAMELSTAWAGILRERGLEVETVARHGDPVDVVLEAARKADAFLVVVGSHGWRGIRRLVLGSVAEAVVRHADRPVLVVKRPE